MTRAVVLLSLPIFLISMLVAWLVVPDDAMAQEETIEIDPWFLTKEVGSYVGNYDEFWNQYECNDVFYSEEQQKQLQRPIHDEATWAFLRGVYLGVVGPNYATVEPDDLFGNGFLVPVTVKQIPGKGRGVIATKDIPEGTLVWDGSDYTAMFPSVIEFRRFLTSIPNRGLVCDILIWAYVEEYDPAEYFDYEPPPFLSHGKSRHIISVDLDEGSFINTVDSTTKKNIDNDTYKTNRLVKAGEELLVDYHDFHQPGNWNLAGFGSTLDIDNDFENHLVNMKQNRISK